MRRPYWWTLGSYFGSNTGIYSVEWTAGTLANWTKKTINGINAYWVRIRILAFTSTGTLPQQGTRRVYRRKRTYGPTIAMNVRNSSVYNDWSEHAALGNLAGLYDYAGDVYGVALGGYQANKPWIGIDDTQGIRIMFGTAPSVTRARWFTDGSLVIGSYDPGQGNFYVDATGNVYLRTGPNWKIRLLTTGDAYIEGVFNIGTAGGIWQGSAGTFAAPNTGYKLYNYGGMGIWESWGAGVKQVYLATDGALYAGQGNVKIDQYGIRFTTGSYSLVNGVRTFAPGAALVWYDPGTQNPSILSLNSGYSGSGYALTSLMTSGAPNQAITGGAQMFIGVEGQTTNGKATIEFRNSMFSTYAYIVLSSSNTSAAGTAKLYIWPDVIEAQGYFRAGNGLGFYLTIGNHPSWASDYVAVWYSGLNGPSGTVSHGTYLLMTNGGHLYLNAPGPGNDVYLQSVGVTLLRAASSGNLYPRGNLYLANQTTVGLIYGDPAASGRAGLYVNGNFTTSAGDLIAQMVSGTGGDIYVGKLSAWLSSLVNQNLSTGATPTFYQVYTNDWFRSNGSTGWYNQTWGGGIYMAESSYVQVYGDKSFMCARGSLGTGGGTRLLMLEGRFNAPNISQLQILGYRATNGTDWTTAPFLIQRLTDGIAQGFISFHGNYIGVGVTMPSYRLELPNNAGTDGQGRANAWVTYSSRTYKQRIRHVPHIREKARHLIARMWDWPETHGGGVDIGLVAEEVQPVFPELVSIAADGSLGLKYDRVGVIALEVMKAHEQEIADLKATIATLEQRLAAVAHLEQRLAKLEGG